MKLKFYFKVAMAASFAAIALWSCSSEIDFTDDSLDTSVTIGGDSLAVPVGSLDTIRMNDFLQMQEGGIVKTDKDGNYYIEFTKDFHRTIDMGNVRDNVRLPEQDIRKDLTFRSDESGTPSGDMFRWAMTPADGSMTYNCDLSSALEYVVSIDRVEFNDATVSLEIPYVNLPDGSRIEVTMSFPDQFEIRDSDIKEHIFSGEVYYGRIDFPAVEIEAVNFGLTEKDDFSDVRFQFMITGIAITTEQGGYNSGNELALNMMLNVSDSEPYAFFGKVNVSTENGYDDMYSGDEDIVMLDGIPSFLKADDVKLVFYNPRLEIELSSNIGVPMTAEAVMTGMDYDMNTGMYEDADESLAIALDAPYTTGNASAPEWVRYWVSPVNPGSDMPAGYEWIQNTELRTFLSRIPDALKVDVEAATDLTKDVRHQLYFDRDYEVGGDMKFILPFEFGSGLYLPVRQTIDGVPEIVSSALSSASLTITGKVFSTLPVDVELGIILLDYDNRQVGALKNVQTIQSANADGTPSESYLNLSSEGMEITGEVYSVALEFVLSSDIDGLSFSDESFLSVQDVTLSVPGGITVNTSVINDNNMNY